MSSGVPRTGARNKLFMPGGGLVTLAIISLETDLRMLHSRIYGLVSVAWF